MSITLIDLLRIGPIRDVICRAMFLRDVAALAACVSDRRLRREVIEVAANTLTTFGGDSGPSGIFAKALKHFRPEAHLAEVFYPPFLFSPGGAWARRSIPVYNTGPADTIPMNALDVASYTCVGEDNAHCLGKFVRAMRRGCAVIGPDVADTPPSIEGTIKAFLTTGLPFVAAPGCSPRIKDALSRVSGAQALEGPLRFAVAGKPWEIPNLIPLAANLAALAREPNSMIIESYHHIRTETRRRRPRGAEPRVAAEMRVFTELFPANGFEYYMVDNHVAFAIITDPYWGADMLPCAPRTRPQLSLTENSAFLHLPFGLYLSRMIFAHGSDPLAVAVSLMPHWNQKLRVDRHTGQGGPYESRIIMSDSPGGEWPWVWAAHSENQEYRVDCTYLYDMHILMPMLTGLCACHSVAIPPMDSRSAFIRGPRIVG